MTGGAAPRARSGSRTSWKEVCMERSRMKRWTRCAILVVVSAAIAVLIAVSRGLSLELPLQLNARYLSDGLFVVGFLLTGMGALIWISTTGFFDIMSYAVKSFLVLFTPLKKPKEHPSFFDYKETREGKRGKPRFSMLGVGVIYLVLSVICLGIYYG